MIRILPYKVDDSPRNSARTAVAVKEEVYPKLRRFFACFEMIIDDTKGVISYLDLMIWAS